MGFPHVRRMCHAWTGILLENTGKRNRGNSGTLLYTRPAPGCEEPSQTPRDRGYRAAAVSPDESRKPGLRRLAEERPEDVVRLADLLRSASGRHEREDLLRLAIVHGPRSVEPDVGQRGQRHVERDGHSVEAVDRDRLLAALDLADELPAEVRSVAESLLTETPLLTQRAQPLTEKASNLSRRS